MTREETGDHSLPSSLPSISPAQSPVVMSRLSSIQENAVSSSPTTEDSSHHGRTVSWTPAPEVQPRPQDMQWRRRFRSLSSDAPPSPAPPPSCPLSLMCDTHERRKTIGLHGESVSSGRLREDSEVSEKRGYMAKEGRIRKRETKRWFVLKESSLFYYGGPDKIQAKGTIPMDTTRVLIPPPRSDAKSAIVLEGENRTYVFFTESEEERNSWANVLRDKTAVLAYTGHCRAARIPPDPRITTFLTQHRATELHLTDVPLSLNAAETLGSALQYNFTLLSLFLDRTEIGDTHVEKLVAGGLKDNNHLTTLSLTKNRITAQSGPVLAEMLTVNRSLKRLLLDDNTLGDEALQPLIPALASHRMLSHLSLRATSIGDETVKLIIEILASPHHLVHLNVAKNCVTDAGTTELATHLKGPASIISNVDLSENEIGNEGVLELATSLRKNTRLIYLNLFGNHIGNSGALALAEMLSVNTTLETLNLGHNRIGEQGLMALARADNFAFPALAFDKIAIGPG